MCTRVHSKSLSLHSHVQSTEYESSEYFAMPVSYILSDFSVNGTTEHDEDSPENRQNEIPRNTTRREATTKPVMVKYKNEDRLKRKSSSNVKALFKKAGLMVKDEGYDRPKRQSNSNVKASLKKAGQGIWGTRKYSGKNIDRDMMSDLVRDAR